MNPLDAVVGSIGAVPRSHILRVASWLWDSGVKTEIFYEETLKVSEQIKIAANKGAKWLVLVGEDEIRNGNIIVRDLLAKQQKII